ncbi:hypothetical protein MHB40_14380 [Lysinibacillus sp. FSL K6-0057]|uniref:hypothetical protein n=1 Tax=Lysinibacillus sp. FSL K6-0057 TaxID=2921411 RepID=UPI00315A0671
MKKFNKSVTVPTIIVCTLGWGVFASKVIQENHKEVSSNVHKYTSDDVEKKLATYRFIPPFDSLKKEYERLKEEERKRLEESERQRLEKERRAKLEQERLARIERERQLAEAKRIEEVKKAEQVRLANENKKQQILNGNSNKQVDIGTQSGWINAEFTAYTAYCPEGCTGTSASGVFLGNSEYYQGYRVVASYKGLPLYTLLELKYPNGTTENAVILDRGGAISHTGILDVLVSSESKAKQFGRINGQYRVIGSLK